VILIDTSAWVEFLRDSRTPTCLAVAHLLDGDIATCDPVAMEVLAGARDEAHLRRLRGLLGRAAMVRCESADYTTAAMLYRTCRRNGETVRRLIDCLIAAVAIRRGFELLHQDADFEVLARHTDLVAATA
jgi:hypothetical protein